MHNPNFIVHTITGYINNIFLLEYESGMLLFDTGVLGDTERIVEYCTGTLNRPVTDIKLIVVSHIHPDHAGGAGKLRKKYGIPVAAHQDIDTWYRGIAGSIQHALDCYLVQIVAKRYRDSVKRVFFRKKINPDIILNNNDVLPFYPEWRVIHAPGHTLHHIVLYHEVEGILFLPDLIVEVKGQYQLPIPVFFKGVMKSSYEKLSKLDIRRILLPHGNEIVTDDASEIFNYMIELLDKPLNSIENYGYRMSVFTPELWKARLRKWRRTRAIRDNELKN